MAKSPKNPPPKSEEPKLNDPDAPEAEQEIDEFGFEKSPKFAWESELKTWAEAEARENEILTLEVYRDRKAPYSGVEKCGEFQNEIIGSHQIGIMFGGGTFYLKLAFPRDAKTGRDRIKRRTFHLSEESYNIAHRQYMAQQLESMGQESNGKAIISNGPPPSQDPLQIMGLMFDKFFKPVIDLISKKQDSGAGEHWKTTNALISGIVEESAKNSINGFRTLTRELALMRSEYANGETAAENETGASDSELKDWFKEILKEHGPALVEAGGLKLKSYLSAIRNDDVFKSLEKSPPVFQRVLDMLLDDKEVDKVQAEKILRKLSANGVAVPIKIHPAQRNGSAPANPAPAPQATGATAD